MCVQVLLSVAYTSLQAFLVSAIGYVVVAMVLASAISLVAGLLVAPSLASDEVGQGGWGGCTQPGACCAAAAAD